MLTYEAIDVTEEISLRGALHISSLSLLASHLAVPGLILGVPKNFSFAVAKIY